MGFKPAVRSEAKLRLAIDAQSGHGKTYTSLLIAGELVRLKLASLIGVGDSERGSAKKYARNKGRPIEAGAWDFLHCDIDQKNPNGYVNLFVEASAAGIDALIADSMSHEWMGALEKVDGLGGWTRGGKVVSPEHQRVIDSILSYPGHVICTFRSKAEHAIEKDEKTGKTTVRKVGMAPVAREGTEFEFDFWFKMEDERVTVTKSRWGAGVPVGSSYHRAEIPALIEKIAGWLTDGAPVDPTNAVIDRVKAAADDAALNAINAAIAALPPEGRAKVKPIYLQRKAEIAANPLG
jgi:hypothetical protein